MRTYELDTDAAKAAHTGSNRITESGQYTGTLVAAFHEKSRNGADGVFFVFDPGQGREAITLSIYTHNKDGEKLVGYDTMNAIMTCLKERKLTPAKGEVELYDFDARAMVKKPKDVFPSLAGKSIGFLLQQEEYLNASNELRTKLSIVGAFEPATGFMANEILAKATAATSLKKSSEWLAKNPVRALRGKRPAATGGSTAPVTDFEDDEIPF